MQFDSYYLVILRRGAAWTPEETPEVEELQKQHLAHLFHLIETGKMLAAGPFEEQDDPTMRGLCLYRVASAKEARDLAEADPAVKAGRLRVELMTWYTPKGQLTFPGKVAK